MFPYYMNKDIDCQSAALLQLFLAAYLNGGRPDPRERAPAKPTPPVKVWPGALQTFIH